MSVDSRDERMMARAVELARRGKGRTSPNPAVGAVIVRGGEIIGEGWHKRAGGPHAEINALASCKTSPKGATMYVTLEPCNHHGRTGPCAAAIIQAGIREVVIGARDASAKPGVKGAVALRRAGVEVRLGPMKRECERLVEDFAKRSSTGLPFVTVKAAVTLDGKVATKTGDSKWISSPQSRREVHRMRNETDAVMVGADTVIADDPELTVRHGRPRRNPLRVVMDGRLRTPVRSKLVATCGQVPTIIATSPAAPAARRRALEKTGVEVLTIKGRGGRVSLKKLLKELGGRGVMNVLIESGGELAGAALRGGVADRVVFYVAPKIAGGPKAAVTGFAVDMMRDAVGLKDVEVRRSGPDVVIEGRIET